MKRERSVRGTSREDVRLVRREQGSDPARSERRRRPRLARSPRCRRELVRRGSSATEGTNVPSVRKRLHPAPARRDVGDLPVDPAGIVAWRLGLSHASRPALRSRSDRLRRTGRPASARAIPSNATFALGRSLPVTLKTIEIVFVPLGGRRAAGGELSGPSADRHRLTATDPAARFGATRRADGSPTYQAPLARPRLAKPATGTEELKLTPEREPEKRLPSLRRAAGAKLRQCLSRRRRERATALGRDHRVNAASLRRDSEPVLESREEGKSGASSRGNSSSSRRM